MLSSDLASSQGDKELSRALEILASRPDYHHEDVAQELDRDFFSQTGRHALVGGRTRTGKTTLLYHLEDSILHQGKEHIAHLDTGKSSEFLTLALFQPLRILIPDARTASGEKLDLKIRLREDVGDRLKTGYNFSEEMVEHLVKNVENSVLVPVPDLMKAAWRECRRGEVAVISIKRFIPDPDLYANYVAKLFTQLILDAYDRMIEVPMTVVADEAQRIAPSRKNNEGFKQYAAGKIIGANLEEMASLGIRFILGTQGWGKLRPTVRDSIEWIFVKRGIRFTHDAGRVYDFEPLWNKIPTTHCYIVRPDQSWTDPYRVPHYPAGWEIGYVDYFGRLV